MMRRAAGPYSKSEKITLGKCKWNDYSRPVQCSLTKFGQGRTGRFKNAGDHQQGVVVHGKERGKQDNVEQRQLPAVDLLYLCVRSRPESRPPRAVGPHHVFTGACCDDS